MLSKRRPGQCLRFAGGQEGGSSPCRPTQPRSPLAAPPCAAPTRLARSVSGFWIRQVEKEVKLCCPKLLDCNLELQRRREPDRPPKKDDYDYDGMNERGINLRLLKALEKNNEIAKHVPPGSSPPSSSSSSSGDSDTRSDRVTKKAKKVKKDHLKRHPKSVKENASSFRHSLKPLNSTC